MTEDNYIKYRGKCKEMSEALVNENPSLRLVRGHYWCPIWNTNEQHWWTIDTNGVIQDPTKLQFPSAGAGEYVEFNGMVACEQCGKEVPEDEADIQGRFAFCSYECYGRCVL